MTAKKTAKRVRKSRAKTNPDTKASKPKEKAVIKAIIKRTRNIVTMEALQRATGVTKDELVAMFDKEFGEGSGKLSTAGMAIYKAGVKIVKEKSETRGMVYRAA